MNYTEFLLHANRLKEQYGDKIYSNERLKGIFSVTENLSESEWDRVVTNLIASCERPPLQQKILEAIAPYRSRMREQTEREFQELKKNSPLCIRCGNDGKILANGREVIKSSAPEGFPMYYSYSFRCPCVVGYSRPEKKWPVWDDSKHLKDYAPIFIEGEFRECTPEEIKEHVANINKALSRGIFRNMPGYEPMSPEERSRAVAESKRRSGIED